MAADPAPKPAIDWERIEADYRAGILSTREIASASGISHTAINKRAKKEGWTRDLSAKIQAKAAELVSRREVAKEVASQRAATERQIIEANAERIAQVRGEHRAIGHRIGNVGLGLLGELELQGACLEDFEKLGELMRQPDDNGMDKLNDVYRKVISTVGRVESAKKTAEVLRHAIAVEREAYGLEDKDGNKTPGGALAGCVVYRAFIPPRGDG